MTPFWFLGTFLAFAALCRGMSREPFDVELARRYAVLSSIAHCPPETLKEWSCVTCRNNASEYKLATVLQDDKYNGYGLVGYSDTEIVVAFRGSVNDGGASPRMNRLIFFSDHDINWIEDFEFFRVAPFSEDPEIKIHQGFWWFWGLSWALFTSFWY